MSSPYQGWDLSHCGVGRLRVAINCGVLSVKHIGSKCSSSLFIATQKATFFLCNVIHQLSSYNHGESRSNTIALQHLLVSNQKNH